MAKVLGPLHSIEARGSVDTLTYNTWRGLHTVKRRCGPHALPSQAVLDQLALAALATAAWKAADQTTRDTWNAWAPLHPGLSWTGQEKRITGYNWFLRLYVRQLLINFAPAPLPPDYAITHTLSGLALTWSAPNLVLSWDAFTWGDADAYYTEIYRTGPLSSGVNPTIHAAFRTSAEDYLTQEYMWPSPAPGTYTAFARLLHTNGLVSTFQSVRCTVPP